MAEPEALVLVAASERVLATTTAPLLMLGAGERARVARLSRPVDRRDFVAARVLARRAAAAVLGGRPADHTLSQTCADCGGPHGRPQLVEHPTVGVSWTHSGGLVCAVVAPAPCGVDAEHVISFARRAGAMLNLLPDAERRAVRSAQDQARSLLSLWVRKEALVKAGAGTLTSVLSTELVEGTLAPYRIEERTVGRHVIAVALDSSVPGLEWRSALGSSGQRRRSRPSTGAATSFSSLTCRARQKITKTATSDDPPTTSATALAGHESPSSRCVTADAAQPTSAAGTAALTRRT